MFGVVLKNSILVFLIILILHFLIQNSILESKLKDESSSPGDKQKCDKKKNSKQQNSRLSNNMNVEKVVNCVDEDNDEDNNCLKFEIDSGMKINLNDKIKELYDFVYEDETAEKKLGEYYKEKNLTKLDSLDDICNTIEVKCDNESEDKKYEKMCEDSIKTHMKENKMVETNSINTVGANNLVKDCVLINEYKDEKSINGGKVFNDMELLGWDDQFAYSTL